MDGAGRLDRSLRSPRPQADLKAAAIGAVLLLRERLGWKRRVVRRSIDRERPRKLIALLERLPKRAGIAATALLLLGSTALGIVRGGHVEEMSAAVSDARNAAANYVGFRITAVAIN